MTSKEQKQKKEQIILSLYPNSIGFGYAIMDNALSVINSQVVQVRPISNTQALKRIKEIITYYEPKIVVIENYHGIGSLKSKRIQKLIEAITRYAIQKNLKIHKYSRSDIRFVFSNFNAHTKYEISCIIAENIKSMEYKLMKPRKISESEKYMAGAFDAVSLGVTHYFMTE
jgi:Holliday junction resolvasome RuvABC endonuclease subunit